MPRHLALAVHVAAAAALPPARGDVKLYRKVVPSTVLFVFDDGDSTSIGSGVLIDVEKSFGKILVEETGDTDQERKGFTAGWSGYARAAVLCVGGKKGTNAYALAVDRFGLRNEDDRLAVPLTLVRRIASGGADAFQFQYQKDAGKARVSVRGDGDTELAVAVEGPNNQVLAQSKCREDRVDLTWMPPADGRYRVTVHNPGNIWNRYILTTD
jgi:hypothetical protein